MTLHLNADDLAKCVGCGLCLPHCPTYRVTGEEIASPRGRIAAMRAVALDGAPLNNAFARAMEECVQCRGCEVACPSSVPFGHLMEHTREALQREGKVHPLRRILEWLALVVVLPRHRLLLFLTWLLLVGQRLHVVPRSVGLPRLHARSLRTPLPAAQAPDAWLFAGCVMDAWQRDVHRAALKVMRAAGVNAGVPAHGADCCGALHAHAGRLDLTRRLARRVISAMPGNAPIVVDSAGCGATMKDYGRLLGTDEAHAFSARVRDFSEWLAARGAPATRATGKSVVVQDACHLRHVQHAEGAVREVLGAAYSLLETDDDGLCCGAGGAYALGQPGLSRAIRRRKVEAIQRAAGGLRVTVVSANPGCSMHLAAVGLDVRHPAELIAEALA